ncbi:hypothetical protein [Streptomyces sp. NPDC059008]|uniref:hypothetical protein n=1 Tax=Streptomyces sp. NPDC059008 TaxID=3346693 RepID=UPI003683BEE9
MNLSDGRTETIVDGVKAYGIGLDGKGKAYITDQDNGQLFEVDLAKKQKRMIVDGLGASASGVALDGNGRAYTGHWNDAGDLYEVDLAKRTKRVVVPLSHASCDIALDGAGKATSPTTVATACTRSIWTTARGARWSNRNPAPSPSVPSRAPARSRVSP